MAARSSVERFPVRPGAPVPRQRVAARPPGAVRRARRQVMVRWVLIVALAGLLVLFMPRLVRGVAGAVAAPAPEVVVVHEGDTLWDLAAARAGGREDVRAMVLRIREANRLADSRIFPGQELIIPR